MTKRLPRITTHQLVTLKACHEQVVLFRATFGQSTILTKRSLAKAVEAGLDFGWLARSTLKGEHSRAYDEATALAWFEAYLAQELHRVDTSA